MRVPTTKARNRSDPSYVSERAELIVRLAFARIPNLIVCDSKASSPYDYLLSTPEGKCFFIVVNSLSSFKGKIADIDNLEAIESQVDTQTLIWANACPNPVFVFLVDADTDHVRILQINDLKPLPSNKTQSLKFLKSDVADRKSLEKIVDSL